MFTRTPRHSFASLRPLAVTALAAALVAVIPAGAPAQQGGGGADAPNPVGKKGLYIYFGGQERSSMSEGGGGDLPVDLATDKGSAFNLNSFMSALGRAGGASAGRVDGNGRTALHWAAINKNADQARLMLEANASVLRPDNEGKTPLHYACESRSKDIVRMLLDRNADPNQRDNSGQTPTFAAARHGDEEIVKMLWEKKARLTIKDNEGLDALNMASRGNHIDLWYQMREWTEKEPGSGGLNLGINESETPAGSSTTTSAAASTPAASTTTPPAAAPATPASGTADDPAGE